MSAQEQVVPKAIGQRPEWADELLDLAVQEATGRFVVASCSGEYAWMWLRDGQLSGVSAAARRPLLSRRLLAFRILSPDRVEQALESIRYAPGQRLLDRVIQDRLAPPSFIDAYVRHVMAEQMASMLHTSVDDVSFEPGRVQRVSPLLLGVHEMMVAAAATPFVIPTEIAEHVMTALHADFPHSYAIQRAVLAASDGRRRPVEVADECGLTAAEMLQVIADLEQHGALELTAGPERDNWMAVSQEEAPAIAPAGPPREPAVPVLDAPPAPTEPVHAEVPPPAPVPAPRAESPPPDPRDRAPIEPDPVAPPTPEPPPHDDFVTLPEATPASRRDAMSLLASLTDSISSAPPEHPEPVEPQAEITTTSRAPVWTTRQTRPSNPMESGEVFRELQSLGTEDAAGPTVPSQSAPEGKDKKRKLFGR